MNEVADYASAAGLVRHGLGIAFLPASAAAGFTDLCRVELADHSLTWGLSIATPATRRMPAAARAFLAELAPAAVS
jgi:DNA-binding transcriptional LysR family regulator